MAFGLLIPEQMASSSSIQGTTLDLATFRGIVDRAPAAISNAGDNLEELYRYVGLPQGNDYKRTSVSQAIYASIQAAFRSGHAAAWQWCKSLRTDLIYEHVLLDKAIDPYFEVLDHLQDALRVDSDPRVPIDGDWDKAVRLAVDHVAISSWGVHRREEHHAREFNVARAARALRTDGVDCRLTPGRLILDEQSETALVAKIEELIAAIGGLNVARRIFGAIASSYDTAQQRYHLTPQISMIGGGAPQIPWGYLLQLAVKHVWKRESRANNDTNWRLLCDLTRAYGAVIDVQPYCYRFLGPMSATELVPYLQEVAVYDTLFRIPQIRPSDVTRLARGSLDWLDRKAPTASGWTIDQVLEVVTFLFACANDRRGPYTIEQSAIQRGCPSIPPDILKCVLEEVLSHPIAGANQNFSRPTDAPNPDDEGLKNRGHDFFLKPLLRQPGRRFLMIDSSVCAPACVEALLLALRPIVKGLDERVGASVERFLAAEFATHGVPVTGGEYAVDSEQGECDLIVPTTSVVMLLEVKKKPLTRRARAGSDAHLMLDLAGSMLAAQAQAGWHEVRVRRHGHLCLRRGSATNRIDLNGREVERLAVSLFDFGSFQDRMLVKQFLEATLASEFKPFDPRLDRKFAELNDSLRDIREQLALLHPGETEVSMPFFHCWFVSVPQLLILLDGVNDPEGFKANLWRCRHIATGSSDLYFDLSYMDRLKDRTNSEGE